jgi:TRAP-type uncharacterized transport system substrate-binding protein
LIALYPEAFTVVARANTSIRDFQDLRGKRVGIGTIGVGYNFTRDVVLGFYGSTMRTPTTGVAGKLFQAVGVALPPNLQELPLTTPQPAA